MKKNLIPKYPKLPRSMALFMGLQGMFPSNALIMVAFIFIQFWSENFAQVPIFQSIGPSIDFLVAQITFSMDFLVAINTKHGFTCCFKYHIMGFFVVAQSTYSIDFFVALKCEF